MAVVTLTAAMAEIKDNPGKLYVYILSRPCGEPFYVGLGKGRRIRFHERTAASAKQSAKLAIIREIAAAGGTVGYEIAGWFDEWTEAAQEERRLIALYGRADHGKGPLTNRTNGGQGISGPEWYTPARLEGAKRAAEKNRGRKLSAEHKAKVGAGLRGRKQSKEWVEKRRAAHVGSSRSPEARAKMSAAKKGKPPANAGQKRSAESRARMSEAQKGRRISPNALAAMAAWRAENADLLSAKRKALWADPAYRQMMLDARRRARRKME